MLFSSQWAYCDSEYLQSRLDMKAQHFIIGSKGKLNNKASWVCPSEGKACGIWSGEMEEFWFSLIRVFS